MRIGFLGYGEAARAFHDGLARPGLSILAHDILLDADDGRMREAMVSRGAEPVAISGLSSVDWIISAVTADQSLLAVEPLLAHLRPAQILIDLNSVSPDRKRDTAAAVNATGAQYLDLAVMAPVHPKKLGTPVLIAGEPAQVLLPKMLELGFNASIAGDRVGAATAIKMVRSLFVKGLEAITVEALLAAEASGCFDEIFDSLTKSYPGLGWPDFALYQFERTTRHGKRRAAEMVESAATLNALGLNGGLATEIANVQAQMGMVGHQDGDDLQQAVRSVLAKRLAVDKG